MRLIGVLLSVFLTFASAVMLDAASETSNLVSAVGALSLFVVFVINLVKFVLWGWLNLRYDLSKTYPITMLIYPCVFAYAVLVGDAALSVQKITGLLVILIGLYLILTTEKGEV